MGRRCITPTELTEGVTQHRLWLESAGERGRRLDLGDGVSLFGYDCLGGVDLRCATLHRADLRYIGMPRANLGDLRKHGHSASS